MDNIHDLREHIDRMLDHLEQYRGSDAQATAVFQSLRHEYESLVDTVLPPDRYRDQNMEYRRLAVHLHNAFMIPGYTPTTARCMVEFQLQEAERRMER